MAQRCVAADEAHKSKTAKLKLTRQRVCEAGMKRDRVNLAAKLQQFHDHRKPRTVARVNTYDIMLVKVQGEFVWHKHDDTD